jgi:preprotein translocase subunit SecE
MTKHRKPSKDKPAAPASADSAAADSAAADSAAISLKKAGEPAARPLAKTRTKREAVEVAPPNAAQRFIQFLKDARRELNRVTWPTSKETVRSTAVLLVLVGVSAIYLALVDGVLTRLLRLIVG